MTKHRRGMIGSPPLRDGDKVRTKRGVGTIEKSQRGPDGVCLYEVVVKVRWNGRLISHRDYYTLAEMQIV